MLRQWPLIGLWPLVIILVMGAVIPQVTDGAQLDTFTKMSTSMQVLYLSWNLVSLILLIDLVQNYRHDKHSLNMFMASFSLTVFLAFFSLLLIKSGHSNVVPAFLVAGGHEVVKSSWRFSTFTGGSQETALYAMFVMVFSILNLIQGKFYWITIPAIIMAPIIGFATGSRSFVLMIGIFISITILCNGCLYLTNIVFSKPHVDMLAPGFMPLINTSNTSNNGGKKNKFPLILIVIIMIAGSSWFAIAKLNFTETLARVKIGTDKAEKSGKISDAATGRDPIEQFPKVLSASGLLGNGSLTFSTLRYNATVGHNTFLNVTAKYGVLGLFMLVLFIMRWLFSIIILLFKRLTSMDALSLTVVLGSVIALIGQEMTFCSINKASCFLPYGLLAFYSWSFSQKYNNANNNRV